MGKEKEEREEEELLFCSLKISSEEIIGTERRESIFC
jgi:hypothetical protein